MWPPRPVIAPARLAIGAEERLCRLSHYACAERSNTGHPFVGAEPEPTGSLLRVHSVRAQTLPPSGVGAFLTSE
jgi:hypothetical protein